MTRAAQAAKSAAGFQAKSQRVADALAGDSVRLSGGGTVTCYDVWNDAERSEVAALAPLVQAWFDARHKVRGTRRA